MSHSQAKDQAAQLAAQIRRLALTAHRLKASPAADASEAERLVSEIDRVMERLSGRRQQPLRRWAQALQREITLGLKPVAQG